MGEKRTFSKHVRWSGVEIEIVRDLYATAAYEVLASMLPGRSLSQIQNKAFALGVARYKEPSRTAEQTREAKRIQMANKRAKDPEGVREYRRKHYHANRDERIATMKAYQKKRFFWMRAVRLKDVTAKDLASIWKKQRGRCGLTGVKLDRRAEVDHIIPKARGGSDAVANLRWVTEAANRAKRDLTDMEFVELCSNVMAFIGRRIQQAIPVRKEAA